LAAYESALAVRPDSLDARYNFALVLKRADYFIDAGNELEKLLTRFPDEPRANLALGNLYANQLQQTTKARQYYLKVLQTDPHNTEASAIRYWLTSNPQ
jgi:tetratricopeptide (TPR) repeat protein